MKFTVLAADLKRALATCNELAPASSSISEEATGVLIRAQNQKAIFMASDETSYVSVTIPAQVVEEGEVLVRCSAVTNSVTASFLVDENPITVQTTSKSTLRIVGTSIASCTRTFPLLDAGFFVKEPIFDRTKATQVSALDFQDGLVAVAYAAAKDPSKPQFNCISVTIDNNEIVFAATDGFQVAEFRKAAQIPEKGLRGSFILGLKFANVLAKHVADILRQRDGVDVVDTYVENGKFFLKSGDTLLVGTLFNTSFPDYQPHLGTEGKLCAVFPKDAFLEVLAGVQPTMDHKSHRLLIKAKKTGKAALFASSETGEAESSDLAVKTSEDFSFNFNALWVQNTVRQLKGDNFEFHFTIPTSPYVVFKSPKSDDFRALICTVKMVS